MNQIKVAIMAIIGFSEVLEINQYKKQSSEQFAVVHYLISNQRLKIREK
ncbi:hypothetical protein J4480_02985 [Candidatus Woesearchaeota archaeon]|nr:hypothetical protein [Candidatus Woesearchaeota archaeon]